MRSAVSVYPINPVGLCLIPWQADQSNETNQNRQLMHHVLCQPGDKRCSTDNCTKIFAQNNCWVKIPKVNVQMILRPVADHSSVCQGSRSPPTISPTPWKPLFPFVTFFFVSFSRLFVIRLPCLLPIAYCLLPRLLTLIVFARAQTLCKGSDVTSSLVQFANWPSNFF